MRTHVGGEVFLRGGNDVLAAARDQLIANHFNQVVEAAKDDKIDEKEDERM